MPKNSFVAMLENARLLRDMAYAPYSHFRVAAVIRGKSGRLYGASNVENAAYPQSQCAEAGAIAAMVAAGEQAIDSILVLGGGSDPCTPCGGCRQRLREFAADEAPIYICGPEGLRLETRLGALLPKSFGPDNLGIHDAHPALRLLDLTSLNDSDTDETVRTLCAKATLPAIPVAAVCVYPRFVPLAVGQLAGSGVRIATVANFPGGDQKEQAVLEQVASSLREGAEEIDLVFPYSTILSKDMEGLKKAERLVAKVKMLCGPARTLKVILETGALKSRSRIHVAANAAIAGGADFLKTSTGKHHPGASIEVAGYLLELIQAHWKDRHHSIGLKISGGVRRRAEAEAYIAVTEKAMGPIWLNPGRFRIGASSLFDDLLGSDAKAGTAGHASPSGY